MTSSAQSNTSFCHVFTQKKRDYVYDVGTNNIYDIDPVLADILPIWTSDNDEEVISQLAERHDREAVQAAIAEIQKARQEEGLFLPHRSEIESSFPACFDRSAYQTCLSHLVLTLTEQCNLRCHYCLHGSSKSWVRPFRDRRMSKETALNALNYFAERCHDSDHPTVSFYGGEPLLRSDLIKAVVREARSHPDWPDLRFVIDTNGTLIDEEAAAFIVQERIYLQVSLDGDITEHDRYRISGTGRGSYESIMAGLRRVLVLDPKAVQRISFIVTLAPPYNIEAVANYFNDFPLYNELGITRRPHVRLNIVDLDGIDLGTEPENLDDRHQLRRNLHQAERLYVEACAAGQRDSLSPATTSFFDKGLISFYHRSRQPLPEVIAPTGCCLPGQRKLHVRADGAFQPCERVGEALLIGNVAEGIDLMAVERLFSDMYGAVRDRCRNCWAVRLCEICFCAIAPTWGEGGSSGCEVPVELCESVKGRQEGFFRFYMSLLDSGPEALDFLKNTTIS